MDNKPELSTDILVETENYSVWRADEPDQEFTFHLELNNVTVHFFKEEWETLNSGCVFIEIRLLSN